MTLSHSQLVDLTEKTIGHREFTRQEAADVIRSFTTNEDDAQAVFAALNADGTVKQSFKDSQEPGHSLWSLFFLDVYDRGGRYVKGALDVLGTTFINGYHQ